MDTGSTRRAFMLLPLAGVAGWLASKLPQEKRRPPQNPSVHVMGDLVVDGEIYMGQRLEAPLIISNCYIQGVGKPVLEVKG